MSTHPSCLSFGVNDMMVSILPRPGFVLKVLTLSMCRKRLDITPPPFESRGAPTLIVSGGALEIYLSLVQDWSPSDQWFVYYGGQERGCALSKQRLPHRIVEAIHLAYECNGESPLKKSKVLKGLNRYLSLSCTLG